MRLKVTAHELRTEARQQMEAPEDTAYEVGRLKLLNRVIEDLGWMTEGKVAQRLEKELEQAEQFGVEAHELLRFAESLRTALNDEVDLKACPRVEFAFTHFAETASTWRARLETLRTLVNAAHWEGEEEE